jgi:hypothetical protein
MTPRWAALAAAILAVGPARPQSPPEQNTLVVAFHDQSVDMRTGEVVYSGGVSLSYGLTTVTADRVVLWTDPTKLGLATGGGSSIVYRSEGIAEGNVRVDDPDGQLTATRLEFNWVSHAGHATNVEIHCDRVLLRASSLDVSDSEWVLNDVDTTTDPSPHPLYVLHARRLVIRPGSIAKARDPALELLGKRILTVPFVQFSLDNRVNGIGIPVIAAEEGGKVGVTSDSSFLLNDRLSMNVDLASYPHELFRSSAQFVYTMVPSSESSGLVAPRSDLVERFAYGYFDDVVTASPESEHQYVRATRDSVSVGTFWNQEAFGRPGSDMLNKPWEVVYERGGPAGDWGVLSQLRLQHIEVVHGFGEDRAVLQTTLEPPTWELGRGFAAQTRLEGEGFFDDDGVFGWGLGQFGLIYSPIADVRFGGALVAGGEFGQAAFPEDRLYSRMGFDLRADWGRGPTKLGFLAKYDFTQNRWYDDEYSLSQIMGCIVPTIYWRRFPNEFLFTISLRADELIDKLERRNFR